MTIFLQIFKDLSFCFQHTVSVPKILQVAGTDIGDHTGVRSCNFCQTGHLAEIADSHFQNCDLILVTKTENGERKA